MTSDGAVVANGLSILVAEDELIVQTVTCSVFEDHGFAVTCASSTEEALQIVEGGNGFDAVLLDIDIGDTGGGYRVARLVRDLNPGTRIVYTSGGNLAEFERHKVSDAEFVPKPYSPDRVCELIEQKLGI